MTKKLLSILALLCMTVSGAWAQDGVEWQVGKVIAANGKVYNTVSAANAAGTTASGVIAYITSGGSAMALSLTNASTGTVFCSSQGYSGWIANYTTPSAAFGAADGVSATNSYVSWQNQGYGTWNAASIARNYSTSRPSIASAWSLPSAGDWNNMLKALAGTNTNLSETSQSVFSTSSVSAKLTAAGASGLSYTLYWSTTENDSYAWSLNLTNTGGSICTTHKSVSAYMYVRPYFTFTVPQQTVTYNANGGSGAPSAQSKNYNASLTLSSTVPTRDGYTFDGWNTKDDGSGTAYAAGATYTANADVTLYAQWTQNTATLTDGEGITALSTWAGKTCTVTYTRSFTADKPSTVCLPFAYAPKTGETFYTFSGITKSGSDYVATMTEAASSPLTANTPYLFIPTGNADFSGTYTIPAELTAGTTTNGDWTFKGTYSTIEWTTAPTTPTYGFSAQDTNDGITQGQFVKVGTYVRIKPMRAYLEYTGSDSQFANARALTRAAATDEDETLPETIKVRLIGADGTVTAIGTLHTRTGEVSFDSEAWYTLDGKRLAGQPTQKGIYVNNGKKVVIK